MEDEMDGGCEFGGGWEGKERREVEEGWTRNLKEDLVVRRRERGGKRREERRDRCKRNKGIGTREKILGLRRRGWERFRGSIGGKGLESGFRD